jgi:soluble lytic murein transglycosylase
MNIITSNFSPDRASTPTLSSDQRRYLWTLLCLGTAMITEPGFAQGAAEIANPMVQTVRPAQPMLVQPVRSTDSLSNALSEWRAIQQSDGLPFSTYASFMIAHPGWPGESGFRKNAEKMLRADTESSSLVIAYFSKFPPLTSAAHLRFAEALDMSGRRGEAQTAARLAWLTGALTPDDEARFLSRYSGVIQPGDNDARMERLLWSRSTQTALRQIVLVSPAKRALFNARLGFLTKAPDAASRDQMVDPSLRTDPGYVADRTYWLRISGQTDTAASYLAQPRQLNMPPQDAGTWLATLEGNARSALGNGQYQTAFAVARLLETTYAPGTLVRDRPFGERDSYTNVAWIGGNTAMNKLGRPADAIRMFELYANAAKSPQTRAKGFYWAGRAAERAGRKDIATLHYSAAAEYFDQFHGQLAFERLGRQVALPLTTGTVEISGAEREAFNRDEVVRAAILLGQNGNHEDQTRFVRTLAANADGAANHALAAELALRINRPDLGLLVGKSAREDGLPGYLKPAFPTTNVPPELSGSWTMIHAITRQESQFDREARSRAGARGLMQLMPGTARETANAAGVSYSLDGLTRNPQDNIRLGSTYFGQLMTSFGGSYVLSVAAYNAGPGNVNKWLRANGDPRNSGVDILDWIEAIPLSETRGYVQRVLENAVIYDLMNPGRSGKSGTRISAFLGRSVSTGAP